MEANPVRVIQYFDGTKQNVIPLFQRAYTWERKNWQTLWDDILAQYHSDGPSSHFMGAIVSMPVRTVPVGVNKHLVIDGQQRLSTVALLLCALRNVLDAQRAARIGDYLTNRHYDGSDFFKLFPTNADRDAFFHLARGEMPALQTARMTQAVQFFGRALTGDDLNGVAIDPVRILETVEQNLQVVMINLGDADDPYLIFESLNHKGEPLSQADLVRNYVLMRFQHSLESGGEQEAVYTQLWRPIEASLQEHLTDFLRHYAMKDGEMIKLGGIYASTKSRFADLAPTAVKSELGTMRRHAEAYERFVTPDQESRPAIASRLSTFVEFDSSTCYPLLLRLFDFNQLGLVSDMELEKSLHLIESYLVRRAITGIPPNVLTRLFLSWSKNITSVDTVHQLHSLIAGTGGRGRWPGDEELRPAFEAGSQYGRKWTRQILVRLERAFEHREPADLSQCTIEHIMPQHLSDAWRTNLGANFAAIHDRLLHTLGNLTLSAYNPDMGNQPFSSKRERLRESNLEMNKSIARQPSWGENEILSRAGELSTSREPSGQVPNLFSHELLNEVAVVMYPLQSNTLQDNERLGQLALSFRSTRQLAERQAIAVDYAETVDRLIENGSWEEMPAPEDQLPDEWMPKAFFDYWLRDK